MAHTIAFAVLSRNLPRPGPAGYYMRCYNAAMKRELWPTPPDTANRRYSRREVFWTVLLFGLFLILSGFGNVFHGLHSMDFPPIKWWNVLQEGWGAIAAGAMQIICGIFLTGFAAIKLR